MIITTALLPRRSLHNSIPPPTPYFDSRQSPPPNPRPIDEKRQRIFAFFRRVDAGFESNLSPDAANLLPTRRWLFYIVDEIVRRLQAAAPAVADAVDYDELQRETTSWTTMTSTDVVDDVVDEARSEGHFRISSLRSTPRDGADPASTSGRKEEEKLEEEDKKLDRRKSPISVSKKPCSFRRHRRHRLF